ncbi:uncharacterized protein LOC114757095 isoform X2 [Neltuma alba]|uniref:uncharacterized protein LOC114757095 isoform X2 n=1 Tax=Neltuma alba TaxID=207710 RepID=UPI0010A50BED|nr:uncharacterized protein LOC114757095 isoform X2 [Prosopis alba]
MAGPLLRDVLLRRFRLQNFRPFVAGISVHVTPHHLFCSGPTVPLSGQTDEKASDAAQISKLPDVLADDEWKEKAKEIVKDIDPIVGLAKDILFSGREE